MFRKCFATVAALMLAVGGLFAEEFEAVFKSFDKDANKVTVKVGDAEKTYKVDPDAKMKIPKYSYYNAKTKQFGTVDEREVPVSKILGAAKDGKVITLTVEKEMVIGARTWTIGKAKEEQKK